MGYRLFFGLVLSIAIDSVFIRIYYENTAEIDLRL